MSETLDKIISHLEQTASLRERIENQQKLSQLHAVQQFQCERLLASHHQMVENRKFRPAIEFFIEELYGPKDFSQRDRDIARVAPKMANLLPEKALTSLETALHLNALSLELDWQIVEQSNGEVITRDSYARAYRQCDNREAREAQLTFIGQLGDDLADVTRIKGISTLLTLSKHPAKVAGVASLHAFLHRGFKAFKKLGDVDAFIKPVLAEEFRIMDMLFDGEINPLPEVSPK